MRFLPFASLLLCGCYVTVPLATTAPDPGTRVHVQLTDTGAGALAGYLGPGVVSVDGRLLVASDTNVAVAVSQVGKVDGDQQFWKGETVSLPRGDIATVQQKKLSGWRSGLLAGAIVAGLVALRAGTAGTTGAPSGGGVGSPK